MAMIKYYGWLIACFPIWLSAQNPVVVGSKHFNEGYILSEMIAQILEQEGFVVERKFNLGGTAISFEALHQGAIDVYPEYTGTITAEILKKSGTVPLKEIAQALSEKYQLEISHPYGFNNTYAIVLPEIKATEWNLRTISDLKLKPEFTGALSYEFLKREDGWQNLAAFYQLPQKVTGIEHGLSYQALSNGKIDFTDAYATDGEIKKYGLIPLTDDKNFFPEYAAVSLYKSSLPPKAKTALSRLDGQISESEMQAMNAQVLFENKDFASIAHAFLEKKGILAISDQVTKSTAMDIWEHTLQHLWLTFLSVLIAVCIALPLGILLYRYQLFLNPMVYLTSIFQTIPSIALLALMIPLLGIGTVPAIVALSIYALLPILRNTISGLKGVDPQLIEVATAIGLNKNQRLKLIELPLALPSILAGIRIASVINVGTATLAAFIGAGGLGEYIVTGLALNNSSIMLQGALPAALLAISIELIFEQIEKRLR